jgi:WD40 repeat protein
LVANKLCWSLDSSQKLLAVCDQATQSLSVYDASTGVLVTSRFIPDMGAYASFSPDARLLAVGSGPNIALIGVAGTSGSSIMLTGSLGPIRKVGFSEDGLSIWGTTEGAKRVIWDVPGGRTISYDPGFWTMDSARVASDTAAGDARVAVLSRDGKVVVTGPAEVQVQPWQISGTSTSIAAHSVVPLVAVSSIDGGSGEINLFELKKPEKKRFELGACQPVDSVFGSNRIYVACSDSDVIEIDYTSGEIRKLDLGILARSVAVTRDRLLIGDFYGMVRQVSEDKKSTTVIADGCLHAANRLVATPDGRYAFNSGLSANNPRCLARIQIPTSEDDSARHSLVIGAGMAAEARGVAVSPDSKLIAYGYADGTVTIFDTEMLNPTSVHPGLGSEVRGLTFGEDGRSLILATRDGRIASIDVSEDYLSVGEKRGLLRQRADRAVEMGLYQRRIEFQDASANKG